MEDQTILIGTLVIVLLIMLMTWLFLEEVDFNMSSGKGLGGTGNGTPGNGTPDNGTDGETPDGETPDGETPDGETPTEEESPSGTPRATPPPVISPEQYARSVPFDELIDQEEYDRTVPITYNPESISTMNSVFSTPRRRIRNRFITQFNAENGGGFPKVPGYHMCPKALTNSETAYRKIQGASVSPISDQTDLNAVASECDSDNDCLAFSLDHNQEGKIFKANDKESEALAKPLTNELREYIYRPLYIKKYPNLNVKGIRLCDTGSKFYPQILGPSER